MEGQMVQLINSNDCLAISPEKENKSNLDHSFNWTPFRRKGRTSVQWSIRSADVDHSVCFGVRLGEQSRIFNLDAWFDSICGCLNQRCAQRHLVQANGFPWFPFPWSSTLHSGECTSFIGTTIDKWLIFADLHNCVRLLICFELTWGKWLQSITNRIAVSDPFDAQQQQLTPISRHLDLLRTI